MPRILVLYDSRTGNTERMAHAVAEGVGEEGVEISMKKIDEARVEDLQDFEGIIIGSPTYFGSMSGKVKHFLDESIKLYRGLEGKVGAAFTSSGGVATGAETTILSILEALLIHGMIVQGTSRGAHYGAAAVGTPDDKELEGCRDFGRRTARLVKRLFP
ncbi:MAG: flavodoxin family protein [Candidatus Bathyarchaeia archaeon]